MRANRCRSFTVGDAMILIAATAVGFGGNRAMGWGLPLGLPIAMRGQFYSTMIERTQLAILPCLTAWTLTFPVLRLRRPRPATRRCFREPGVIACSAASMGIVVTVLGIFTLKIIWSPLTFSNFVTDRELIIHAERVSFMVLGAWFALVLVRGWGPIPCWIDRIGRLLGVLWIVMGTLRMMRLLVFALV